MRFYDEALLVDETILSVRLLVSRWLRAASHEPVLFAQVSDRPWKTLAKKNQKNLHMHVTSIRDLLFFISRDGAHLCVKR